MGQKHKLAGKTEKESLLIDILTHEANDLVINVLKCMKCPKVIQESVKAEFLAKFEPKLQEFEDFMKEKQFTLGEDLSYADFLLYTGLDYLRYYDAQVLEKYDELKNYCDRMEALPELDKYFKSDKFVRAPGPMFVKST